jgi:hypothetical protein
MQKTLSAFQRAVCISVPAFDLHLKYPIGPATCAALARSSVVSPQFHQKNAKHTNTFTLELITNKGDRLCTVNVILIRTVSIS